MTLPRPLVDTNWLHEHLDDPDLRILDCTVFLTPDAERGSYRVESGRGHWERAHIPGAGFADLPHDLSDPNQQLRFMMPPAAQFADAMSRYGVGDGTRVVLYDTAMTMWAARVWWMLRAFGFDDAAVLNGGWKKWTLEGRPTTSAPPSHPPGNFIPHPRPGLIAKKDEVRAAIEDGRTCLVNALTADQHAGRGPDVYPRKGRIPGSVNVPATGAVDPETHAFLPLERIREAFETTGATQSERVVTYCGGGIAASSDALLLTALGHENVAVYDGSLSEWAADPAMPMEVD